MNNLKIIVCPNDYKMSLLNDLVNDNTIHNIKFMTKEEYLSNYFFKYDERTIFYLMDKYKYNLDVCKTYLNNMYPIDIKKTYKSKKLVFLQELKKELIEHNLLTFNPLFREYIKNKEVMTISYYDLDKYEEEALNTHISYPSTTINNKIYEFPTLEEEVNYVAIKIIDLLNNGVDINNIYLTNIDSNYYYTLDHIFSYYNIPININFKDSIYSSSIVQDYLKDNTLDLDNPNKLKINKLLISVLGSISNLDNTSPVYRKILVDKLKNTYISPTKYDNAINIVDLYSHKFNKNDYVFLLGFNQDSIPHLVTDIDFIDDSIKDEVSMYKTSTINTRTKSTIKYILSNINNLCITYKLSTPFQEFYKSNLIDEENLSVIKPTDYDLFNNSNIYNKIRLGEYLDNFYLYGEQNKYLLRLNSTYDIGYNTYSNKYTKVNIPHNKISLSYTSINTYSECKFKYYIKYILKLDQFEDSFKTLIGEAFHYILSIYNKDNFNLDYEWNNYFKDKELTNKQEVLLVRIKKELVKLLEVIKHQNLLTGFNSELHEKRLEVEEDLPIPNNINGTIDKIMYTNRNGKFNYVVIDYKTGNIDTDLHPVKYGLHMQLPMYLYLIEKSNYFDNTHFVGMYYERILFDYLSYSSKLEKEKEDEFKLMGYSTDDTSILEVFDSTMECSDLIKSMKYKDNKFDRHSKILNEEEIDNLIKYTRNIVRKTIENINSNDYSINPKIYNKNEVSCKYCKFKDLCYVEENEKVYLNKPDDFSFLGGEENVLD